MAGRNQRTELFDRLKDRARVPAVEREKTPRTLFGIKPEPEPNSVPETEETLQTLGEVRQKLGLGLSTPVDTPAQPQPDPARYRDAVESANQAKAEVERLRNLLDEQQKAAMEALQTALVSEQRRAESEKQRDSVALEPPRKGTHSSQEANLIRATLERTQKDLERERAARAVEAERASHKIHALEKQLVTASSLVGKIERSRRNKTRLRIAWIAAAVLASGSLAFWAVVHFSLLGVGARLRPAVIPQSATLIRPAEGTLPAASTPPRVVTGDVTNSVSRLSQALSRFGGQDPEEIFKAVNLKQPKGHDPVCSFEWRNGQPALLLGSSHGGTKRPSMVSALNGCADAVERFR